MRGLLIRVSSLPCRTANILKQEMLALGGDCAVATWAVGCTRPETDAVLMGTIKQLRRLTEKLLRQPFKLKELGTALASLLERLDKPSGQILRTPRREWVLGERTLLMGILNVTPDSFSDGGLFDDPDRAVAEGLRMAEAGADMIDIGGESSRPGAAPVSPEEELQRVLPVVEGLARRIDVPLSIDTMKAVVAREALRSGAEIVNDISAMRFDPDMAPLVAEAGAAVVLMHMRGTPQTMQTGDLSYKDLLGEIGAFLEERIEAAVAMGILRERIAVDPGVGFGKTVEDNLRLVRHLTELTTLGRPLVMGVSRKSFIRVVTEDEGRERLEGTAAAVTAAILAGAAIVRVHDVIAMKKVVRMADALRRAGCEG